MTSRDKTKQTPVKFKAPMKFKSISQVDLPQGRHGKHKAIVTQLLSDLDQLRPGQALKIPLTELPDTKENIRSALNRATRIKGLDVATSSDNDHFYVWVPEHTST
jgi:TusA-related sulfurtransferase